MADRIPLIEPVVGDDELENVKSVLESGYMTQGPYAQEFEEKFSELTGADHSITATSCTTGLELALEALDVGPGDEVIVPDYTHPASANAVAHVGAEPVLVDVDRRTYNIDLDAAAAAVTEDTAAAIPVSWGGQPLDADALYDAVGDDVPVVEDAACSVGATYEGTPVGDQFDASVFSFHPRKVIATGEGGMVTTSDADLANEMRSIKNFGTDPTAEGIEFVRADSTNLRLSDVLASIGVAQLEKRDEILSRRWELAANYDELLAEVDGVIPPAVIDGGKHNYQSYCVYVEAGDEDFRDELIQILDDENIESQIGTYALHRTQAFADTKRVGDLTNSTALFHNLLTLPMAHSMSGTDQRHVVETLEDAL